MKKTSRRRIDVNVEELNRIIDSGMSAPLSEADPHLSAGWRELVRVSERVAAACGRTGRKTGGLDAVELRERLTHPPPA